MFCDLASASMSSTAIDEDLWDVPSPGIGCAQQSAQIEPHIDQVHLEVTGHADAQSRLRCVRA